MYTYISLCIYICQDCNWRGRKWHVPLHLHFVLICMRKIKSRSFVLFPLFFLRYLWSLPGDSKHVNCKSLLVSSLKRGQFNATESRSRLPVVLFPPKFHSHSSPFFTQSSLVYRAHGRYVREMRVTRLKLWKARLASLDRRFTRVYINSRIN